MTGGETAPLTEAQSGLWYAQRLDPANPIFNTGQYIDLKGPLDLNAFQAAVDQVGEEAQALALRFTEGPGGASQQVDQSRRPSLAIIDLCAERDPQATALDAIQKDIARAVDPLADPLAGQALYRLADDHHIWAQRVHHLVNDGYGMVLLTNRVAELYGAACGARAAGRPFSSIEQLWAEDAAYVASAARTQDAAWWHHYLAGIDDVVGMAPGRALSARSFHRHERAMETETRAALLALAKEAGINWPDALTALVGAYCRRFTGTSELLIGVPHMGRFGSVSARVPAMVMNVLPIRVAPDEDGSIADYIAALSDTLTQARKHGRYRSEQLRRDLGLIGGAKRLYGPLVNVQPYDRPPRFHGLDATLHVTGTGPVEDINFTFRGDAVQGLTLEIDANPNLYTQEEVAAHGERLAIFLANAVRADTLSAVQTATPQEARRELEAYNATAHPVPDTSLAALIEHAMRAFPDRPAVSFGSETWDYAELDRRSRALAQELRERGVGAEAIVAVALPRSLELVVALVAILRAGGAYLPIDLDHPPARIATILAQAALMLILAQDDPAELYGDRLFSPSHWSQERGESLSPPSATDPAYVIFTSGSTGNPKGVVITHRAIVNRLLWMQSQYGIDSDDVILQKTPATFDVSVWEFFLPLISGARLVVAPPGAHRDPRAIAGLIRDYGVTALHFVPSMLALFLDAPDSAGMQVTRVFCSGEELSPDLRDHFHRRIRAQLHNLYGPTEAAVDVSYWPADAGDASRPVPIGHPVWNTRLLVLDDRLRPAPPGVVGRLFLGGVQLARGYLGREDLTAQRFVPDPFAPGERLYDTGDLAKRRSDGAILFLGRADDQVKIRGLRIELGEIEAAIVASGLTRAQAVIAREGRLIAYVTPGPDYGADKLRHCLTARLPDYMVPAALVELEALPVTANGKLDRKALPRPVLGERDGEGPATPTEQLIADLYAEILKLDVPPSRRADFFALGGDSLSAVHLTLRLSERIGRDPGLAALFEWPDVAGLAAHVDAMEDGGDAGTGPLITLRRASEEVMPPLFLIHPAGGLCWGYRTLAMALSPARTVFGLQSPALDPDAPPPASIDALAAAYARRISQARPHGPCHLAGWSVGGILAQAVAAELRAMGREVGLLALLDAYPAECWRDAPEPTQAQALRALLAIAGHDPDAYPHLATRAAVTAFLRAGDSPLGSLPARTLDGVVRTVLDTNRLVRGHHHRAFDGTLTHIRAANDHKDRPDLTADLWRAHAALVDGVAVPFLHSEMTGAAASALIAPILSQRMAACEAVPA